MKIDHGLAPGTVVNSSNHSGGLVKPLIKLDMASNYVQIFYLGVYV